MKYLVVICTLCLGYVFTGYKHHPENILNNKLPDFEVFTPQNQAIILYDKKGNALDSITAHLLAEDIFKVTNYKPQVVTSLKKAKDHVIVIGDIHSKLIKAFLGNETLPRGFEHQWESYLYKTLSKPNKKIKKAFIIAGTNARGTAYGIFNISKQMGVNPWYWWADVPVKKQTELILNQPDFYSKPPSVKYRGIFLNDEDWGLQPWAAKTFEPETGDIGPKTYAKIFELLLRLNANTIWPAMHESTKAFFYYPGNPKMASLYNIVLGTSHAEPMLRNNVDEWNKEAFGAFNYATNKTNVLKYWEHRVKTAKNIDAIYTMGMRGVHDSGMEGVSSNKEAVELLDGILKDQRALLKSHINPKVENIPQAFTVYKEVLDLYKNGLEVPEDITLVWTDDNYGYIRALSNSNEQKRQGGSGVYYHASYWGRPHDYLWLDTTNPHLIREEMMKAYNLNNRNIWILNVGDIKPIEYSTQLFLDMAYNAETFQTPSAINNHQEAFYSTIFGNQAGKTISQIKDTYYQLAFERKPEFMGWSQTEPTTPIYNTAYNTLSYGDEVSKRLLAYQNIEDQAKHIETQLPENLKSAFVQLVSYPVEAASNMNKKFLYRQKAVTYAKQGRKSATFYKKLSEDAYNNIISLTEKYNNLSDGKWQGMMDMKPRRLPVFDNPDIEINEINTLESIDIAVEDSITTAQGSFKLPAFYVGDDASHFIDVFLKKDIPSTWQISNLPNWIHATKTSGTLNPPDALEQRIHVAIDWDLWNLAGKPLSYPLKFNINSNIKTVEITISNVYASTKPNSFIEKNGLAVIYANHFSNYINKGNFQWKSIEGFGHSKAVMQSEPLTSGPVLNTENAPVLEYEMYTETVTKNATLTIVAIPSHPLTTDADLRIAVQWNDEPLKTINFKTEGRSNTWKQNVLTNKAEKQIQVPIETQGKQTLKIYMIDAGVMLDYVILNASKAKSLPYSLPNETKK